MISLPQCPDCGAKTKVKYSTDSWAAVYECPNGHRWEVIFGDDMGGSSDALRRLPDAPR